MSCSLFVSPLSHIEGVGRGWSTFLLIVSPLLLPTGSIIDLVSEYAASVVVILPSLQHTHIHASSPYTTDTTDVQTSNLVQLLFWSSFFLA